MRPLACLLIWLIISSVAAFIQNSSNCYIGLREETYLFSLDHYPKNSSVLQKMDNLLNKAKNTRAILFIADPKVFDGVGTRVFKMFAAVNVHVLILTEYRKVLAEYKPGIDLLIELAINLHFGRIHPQWECAIPIPVEDYNQHYRILIQSEQLNGRFQTEMFKYVLQCHSSPNCVIWEYSDHNYQLIKEDSDAYLSTIVLPIMFQDVKFEAESVSVPLVNRTLDYFGAADIVGSRRKHFRAMSDSYKNEHHLKGAYGVNRKPDQLRYSYQHARVCLCIHTESSPSAGQYHRLSELIQFGCIPVFEQFADKIWGRSMSECGNVMFADGPNEVMYMSHMIAQEIATAAVDWQRVVDDALLWWKHQFEEINFVLKDLMGSGLHIN